MTDLLLVDWGYTYYGLQHEGIGANDDFELVIQFCGPLPSDAVIRVMPMRAIGTYRGNVPVDCGLQFFFPVLTSP